MTKGNRKVQSRKEEVYAITREAHFHTDHNMKPSDKDLRAIKHFSGRVFKICRYDQNGGLNYVAYASDPYGNVTNIPIDLSLLMA